MQLRYKAFILDDEPGEHLNNGYHLQIGDKNYKLSSFNALEEISLGKELFLEYLQLIATDGSAIPEEKCLFKAWKHEFIEHGWRNYF